MPDDLNACCQEKYSLTMTPDLPISDQTDMFPGEIHCVIPICSVKQCPLVVLQSRNCRPSPIIQDSRSIDQDITVMTEFLTCLNISDLDIVPSISSIPVCSCNLMLCSDVIFEMVLRCKIVKVREDLSTACIYSRPIKFRFETPGVIVSGYVACTSALGQ